MAPQPGFFHLDVRLQQLSSGGDPLECLSVVLDFELFRKPLAKALNHNPNFSSKIAFGGAARRAPIVPETTARNCLKWGSQDIG